ncbi:MAG: 5-carboxymethyl-2-hydroxymuconate isomerase [Aliishimia sp.]
MPHVSIEFSKGLEQTHDFQLICKDVFEALANQAAFGDPEAIKIRARPVEYFCIGSDKQTFVHATLLLIEGRSEQVRKHLNKVILDILAANLPEAASLTVQDMDITKATYAKRLL